MKKQYQEPTIEIIEFELDEPIAAKSTSEVDFFFLDGDLYDD